MIRQDFCYWRTYGPNVFYPKYTITLKFNFVVKICTCLTDPRTRHRRMCLVHSNSFCSLHSSCKKKLFLEFSSSGIKSYTMSKQILLVSRHINITSAENDYFLQSKLCIYQIKCFTLLSKAMNYRIH